MFGHLDGELTTPLQDELLSMDCLVEHERGREMLLSRQSRVTAVTKLFVRSARNSSGEAVSI